MAFSLNLYHLTYLLDVLRCCAYAIRMYTCDSSLGSSLPVDE